MSLQPMLLERHLLPKVWGGRALQQLLGIELPPGVAVGESWELFDRPEGSSRIRGSQHTVADLMQAHAAELLGAGVAAGPGGRFPLMLKFLDAREALSVQVHPDDAAAARDADSHADGGKSEACVVLHAGPAARMVRGLRPGVDPARFAAMAHTAAVEELLWAFRPAVGDCIDIPAGTVHAIGPDVVVFEVQQNSDLTYRLYDWGRDRPVQVDKALRVANPAAGGLPTVPPQPLPDGGQLVVQGRFFRVRRYADAAPRRLLPQGRYATITVVGGAGELVYAGAVGSSSLPLRCGDTVLVPAAVVWVEVVPAPQLDWFVCDPGET